MDYFKHYSTASEGNTINHLFDKFGHQGYSGWFLLLELCCANWDGKSEPKFNFFRSIVRKKLRITDKRLELFLGFCGEITELSWQVSGKNIEIYVPMLAEVKETRGRISGNKIKKTDIYRLDKEEDKEEDKDNNKPKKILPPVSPQENLKKASPLSFLFDSSPEIQSWLDAGSHDTHLLLLKAHSHHVLVDLIGKAFMWAQPKGARAEHWLTTFTANKSTHGYGFKSAHKANSRVTHGNPTGNPYLNDDGSVKEMEA